MYFEQLHLRGFGCLRTRVDFAPDRVNLAVADNEAGKSTLIAALLAAFYGIEEDKRRLTTRIRPHRQRVLPWSNPEVFGLILDFHLNGVNWRIERDFNSGQVSLSDRSTGQDHAEKYYRGNNSYAFGEELIGLSCDDFLKSFYLKQDEISEIKEAGGLIPHIQRVATAREGSATSEQALQRLEAALKEYPYQNTKELRIETALKRMRLEHDNLSTELERLAQSRAAIELSCRRLAEIEKQVVEIKLQREECENAGNRAKIHELSQFIAQQRQLQTDRSRIEAQLAELKPYEQFPAGKEDQLNQLAGRVEQLQSALDKQREKLRGDVGDRLQQIEKNLQANSDLAGITEVELRELETLTPRFTDRRERAEEARRECERRERKLTAEGVERSRFNRLQTAFNGLRAEERKFLEEFRPHYTEVESLFRETHVKREWLEKERGSLVARRQRVVGASRMFGLLAAVMAVAGGIMFMLTLGEWMSWVLAGLGLVFGGVSAMVRFSGGIGDKPAIRKLEGEIIEAQKQEDATQRRLEEVGRDLTDLAKRSGFLDGNELLSEYFGFSRLMDIVNPLLEAERILERAGDDEKRALEQLQPFFYRAGEPLPHLETATTEAAKLLKRYREVVRLGEDYKTTKIVKDDLEREISRLEGDLTSNRELCYEILRGGGINRFEPLTGAVGEFKSALEKHRLYLRLAQDQLPRLNREILPEVDLNAKIERLNQLKARSPDADKAPPPDHSEEYYRDQADRLIRQSEEIVNERSTLLRKVSSVYDNFETHHPQLMRRLAEVEDEIDRTETFKGEIETAVRIMTDISREVYKSWAAALSEEAAPFLHELNPRYNALTFSENLTFTILDTQTSRLLNSSEVDTILSSGARDEVLLAVRLGIASYLARGAKGIIPIVLDEPLAAADDDKFVSGMKFFMEVLSQRCQILIMSCHEERHRWLKERLPELYSQRIYEIKLES